MTGRGHRRVRVCGVVAVVALAAACSNQPAPMVFDTVPPGESPVPATSAAPQRPSSTTPSGSSTTPVAASTATTAVGAAWRPATGNLSALRNDCGVVSYLALQPDGRTLVAAVPQNGFWSSGDAGASWTQLGTSDAEGVLAMPTSIVFDPAQPSRMWASGIYTGGVARSDDAAASFGRLGAVTHVDSVSVDLTDPARATLLAGAHEARSVYRSTDAGATWTDVVGGLPERSGMSTAPYVLDAQTFLLGTSADIGAGVFRTADGGVTWNRRWEGAVVSRPVFDRGRLYFLLDGGAGVISSADRGLTWSRHGGGGVTGGRGGLAQGSRSLIALPDGSLASIGERRLVVSNDQGDSWRPIGPPLPFTPNEVIYSPTHRRFVVWHNACTDQEATSAVPIKPNSIMTLEFAVEVPPVTPPAAPTSRPTGWRSTGSG